jgi:hypothetical protein
MASHKYKFLKYLFFKHDASSNQTPNAARCELLVLPADDI